MKLALVALSFLGAIIGANGYTILPEKKVCPTSTSFVGNTNNNHNDCLKTTLSLRGGEVLEPTTLDDVTTIIMKASNEGKLVVIDFSATWCGPCKMISPVYHELSESEDFSNVVFLKVDVDENPDTAAKYEVSAMPTFLFIKRGEVVDKLMGANPAALKGMLEELA
mmetsp:Transcript_5724/g.7043  ORF Transcript_5724/g.7043 Transcript_5724/m.7043 type:complete len:166 (+) Transcript_5724:95-592(+)